MISHRPSYRVPSLLNWPVLISSLHCVPCTVSMYGTFNKINTNATIATYSLFHCCQTKTHETSQTQTQILSLKDLGACLVSPNFTLATPSINTRHRLRPLYFAHVTFPIRSMFQVCKIQGLFGKPQIFTIHLPPPATHSCASMCPSAASHTWNLTFGIIHF